MGINQLRTGGAPPFFDFCPYIFPIEISIQRHFAESNLRGLPSHVWFLIEKKNDFPGPRLDDKDRHSMVGVKMFEPRQPTHNYLILCMYMHTHTHICVCVLIYWIIEISSHWDIYVFIYLSMYLCIYLCIHFFIQVLGLSIDVFHYIILSSTVNLTSTWRPAYLLSSMEEKTGQPCSLDFFLSQRLFGAKWCLKQWVLITSEMYSKGPWGQTLQVLLGPWEPWGALIIAT